tara:strand:- start:667 stop:1062 length:396 start_codon:yes stop_codon:yes gene_type:complete
MKISIPVSVGELLDKISILEIKKERIQESDKKKNVSTELNLLRKVQIDSELVETICPKILDQLCQQLKKVNEELWKVEDKLRLLEEESNFSIAFVNFARSVYRLNDERAQIKRKINELSGSELVEEKSYKG